MSRRPVARFVGLWLLACFGLGACSEPDPADVSSSHAISVLLITLDTTRRDALGTYGREPSPSPHLDRLAERSLVFENARTVTPMTLPSHASMLTGLVPPRHSVRDNSHSSLPAAAWSIAEAAQQAGVRTAAVIAAPVLDPAYGLARGFDSYDAPTQAEARRTGRHGGRRADDVTHRAVEFLQSLEPGAPFFLWVHYFDPHEVYEPAPAHRQAAGGDLYHGEVAQMDAGVGALLEALRATPHAGDTAIVVTADHGEALGEHGEETHSAFVYDSTLMVPLIVFDPRRDLTERVVEPVSVVDVAPTIAGLIGVDAPSSIDGADLLVAERDPQRAVYFESLYGAGYYRWSPLVGLITEGRKFIHSSTPEIYDVGSDPRELSPIADPAFASRARTRLEELLALPRIGGVQRSESGPDIDELRRLGYVGAGLDADSIGNELLTRGWPSPHDRAAELQTMRGIMARHASGDREGTIEPLLAVLAKEPDNPTALSLVGQNLRALGRAQEAIPYLERFANGGTRWPATWLELARALVMTSDIEAALAWYDRVLAEKRSTSVAKEIAGVFQHLGRGEDGLEWLAERGFSTQPPSNDGR